MNPITKLNSGDYITIPLFCGEEEVEVFCTGDNQFDDEGDSKEDGFPLIQAELDCLNWFLENININDYKKEITAYCNERYEMCSDTEITEEDLPDEVSIFAIAINVTSLFQSNDGFVYPEISFYGDCECDPEHGICIGFRDKKFLGIYSQDWTL